MSVLLLFMFIKYLLADELGRFFLDNLVLPDKIENNLLIAKHFKTNLMSIYA